MKAFTCYYDSSCILLKALTCFLESTSHSKGPWRRDRSHNFCTGNIHTAWFSTAENTKKKQGNHYQK